MKTKFEQLLESVQGKKVDVVGIGISNTPVIKLLSSAGACVTAYDKNSRERLGGIADELEKMGVTLVLGDNYLDNLTGDIVVKTPGLRFDHPTIAAAVARGAKLTSEMELFFDVCPCKIIAVTGSDGKTTTTSIIYEMLKRAGYTVHLGGNIGMPLLPQTPDIKESDIVVAELSSFQLHTMRKSPDIAVITNLSPNHLDVHKSMEEYVEAKKNIYLYQNEKGRLVVNCGNAVTNPLRTVGKTVQFSFGDTPELEGVYYKDGTVYTTDGEKLLERGDILLRGDHNVENYMAAILAVDGLVSKDVIVDTVRNFGGVRHRIEYVCDKNGVKFYNDSIGSSPTRTVATLRSFEKKVILIAGGYDKKLPFDTLADACRDRVKALFLTGATADKINECVKAHGIDVPTFVIDDFDMTVKRAYEYAKSGDTVLLSPACASFDKFKNFEVRGDRFIEVVKGL